MLLKKRSYLGFIGLNIITCGIYGVYFIYITSKDVNQMSGRKVVDPVLSVVLYFVTCGLYMFYWYYVIGNELQVIGNANGCEIKDSGMTYLVLLVLGNFTCFITSILGMFFFFTNLGLCVDSYNENLIEEVI